MVSEKRHGELENNRKKLRTRYDSVVLQDVPHHPPTIAPVLSSYAPWIYLPIPFLPPFFPCLFAFLQCLWFLLPCVCNASRRKIVSKLPSVLQRQRFVMVWFGIYLLFVTTATDVRKKCEPKICSYQQSHASPNRDPAICLRSRPRR